MSIKELRKRIDEVDKKIIQLLNKRAQLVKEVGEKKKDKKLSIYVPAREKEIFNKLSKIKKGPLPPVAIKNIFKEILSACLSLQKEVKIAYLGPEATFTHQAALNKFGTSVHCIPFHSIQDVFYQVESKNVDYGVVPIENSTEGRVSHTLDMFINSSLKICAEIYLDILHYLLSKSNRIDTIDRIYSNSQAFAQCKNWIRNNLKEDIEFIEVATTSQAAQIIQKDSKAAAIGSKLATELYNLNILAENIQDSPYNKTRFLVIGHTINQKSGYDKTSLMFSVRHEAGALFKALKPFYEHKINMTMIESRPTGMKPWEYVFFIDVQGHYKDKRLQIALNKMRKECLFLKILGSYPEAE